MKRAVDTRDRDLLGGSWKIATEIREEFGWATVVKLAPDYSRRGVWEVHGALGQAGVGGLWKAKFLAADTFPNASGKSLGLVFFDVVFALDKHLSGVIDCGGGVDLVLEG